MCQQSICHSHLIILFESIYSKEIGYKTIETGEFSIFPKLFDVVSSLWSLILKTHILIFHTYQWILLMAGIITFPKGAEVRVVLIQLIQSFRKEYFPWM